MSVNTPEGNPGSYDDGQDLVARAERYMNGLGNDGFWEFRKAEVEGTLQNSDQQPEWSVSEELRSDEGYPFGGFRSALGGVALAEPGHGFETNPPIDPHTNGGMPEAPTRGLHVLGLGLGRHGVSAVLRHQGNYRLM